MIRWLSIRGPVGLVLAALALALTACTGSSPKASGPSISSSVAPTGGAPTGGAPTGVASSAPTSPPFSSSSSQSASNGSQPAQNLIATAAVKAALVTSYADYRHIPATDVIGTRPGTVYYAYLPSSRTYWATAVFEQSPAANLQAAVGFQDGGDGGVFHHTVGEPWTDNGGYGAPGPCAGAFLPALIAVWHLSFPSGCSILSGAGSTATPGTS